MSELILVKHAAPRIVEGVPSAEWRLSERGRAQSRELGARIAPLDPVRLFASEEPKAHECAEILGSALGLPVEPHLGLRENDRTGFPFFQDAAGLEAHLREFFARPSERVIGNESADEAHRRFSAAVIEITRDEPAGPRVAVTHGTVISLLVARANRLDPFPFWRELELASYVVVSIPGLELGDRGSVA